MSGRNQSDSPLETVARAMQPESGELMPCWRMVVSGIEYRILDADALGEVIRAIRAGEDYIVDELAFEFIGGRLRIRLLDDKAYCSPEAILILLDDLSKRSADFL